MIVLVNVLVGVLGAYVTLGLLFAIPFVLRGVQKIDPVAENGTWGFRLIILPAVVALWPVMLRRWLTGAPPPAERNAHRRAAKESRP